MKNESLWNITHKKYKEVMKYVNGFKPRFDWSQSQLNEFEKKIELLKNTFNSNTILEEIKYRYGKEPGFYMDIDLIGKEVRKW